MTDRFSITDHIDRSVVRITFVGELDRAAVTAFEDHLAKWLDEPDVLWVVLDLAGTTFIDSLGLDAIIRAQRQSIDVGKIFGVAGASGEVARVFELTGLATVLSLPEDTVAKPDIAS